MRKLIFLFTVPLVLSIQQRNLGTTQLFNDNLELLNGHIKQLNEEEHNHTAESEYRLSLVTITNFDRQGNTQSQRIEDIWEKKWREIKYIYKYNKKGEKTEIIVKTPDKTTWKYNYGDHDDIVESMFYWDTNKLKGKESYKYDKAGNVIEVYPDTSGYFYKRIYLYNYKGQLIKETERPNDKGQGLDYLIEYKSFDIKGNWLKKIRLKQFGPANMWSRDTITRKITYY